MKCTQYWPHDSQPVFYHDFQVSIRSESVLNEYTIRVLDVALVCYSLFLLLHIFIPFFVNNTNHVLTPFLSVELFLFYIFHSNEEYIKIYFAKNRYLPNCFFDLPGMYKKLFYQFQRHFIWSLLNKTYEYVVRSTRVVFSIFLEAGIANAISSFKRRNIFIFNKNISDIELLDELSIDPNLIDQIYCSFYY